MSGVLADKLALRCGSCGAEWDARLTLSTPAGRAAATRDLRCPSGCPPSLAVIYRRLDADDGEDGP
jgi:hypothetical protein